MMKPHNLNTSLLTSWSVVCLTVFRLYYFALLLFLSLSLILRPTVSRPVCLGIKRPSGAYDQILLLPDN
jgi:hypothetical protein